MSIKKIAEAAGVSIATVSRVLNNPDYHCAKPGLRDRIWQIAMEMNYAPNEAARNLKKKAVTCEQPYYIQILLTRGGVAGQTDPFFREILNVVETQIHKENGILVVDPDEAEIVKIIYDKFAHTDMGTEAIAEYLNDHGYVKNRTRDFEIGYFSRNLVKKILDNPVYLGKIAYGRTTTEKIKGTRDQFHRVATDDYLLTEGQHDSIIDEDTWAAVREKRAETGQRD